jgi:hypothetical protein
MAGEDPFGPFDGGVYAAAVVAERAKALIQERVELVLGEETRVVLRPPRKSAVLLVGRLTDAGNPVPGTRVIGSHEDDSYWSRGLEATTDADGVFEMQLDRPGDWLLAPQLEEGDAHASFSIRVPRVERHAVELALPGGRIGGTVRGPAGPLAGLRVHAVGEEGATSFELRADVSGVRTDDAGRYELRRLRPGTYTVRVTSALQGFSRPSVSTGFAAAVRGGIPVADAGLSRVDFELVPGGIVEGFARDTEGRPVAGAAVHVRLEDGTRTEVFASSLSDARGRFRITDVPAGSVTLSARTTALAAAESARVSVKTSETSAVELVLSAGAVLDVRVVDEGGAALAFDLSTRDAHGFEVPGLWIERDLKDSLFSVTRRRVGPLPLGTYSIAARTRDGRSVTESVALSAPGLREVVLRLPD